MAGLAHILRWGESVKIGAAMTFRAFYSRFVVMYCVSGCIGNCFH